MSGGAVLGGCSPPPTPLGRNMRPCTRTTPKMIMYCINKKIPLSGRAEKGDTVRWKIEHNDGVQGVTPPAEGGLGGASSPS